ncbi:hypothetical protein [Comamonas testosteroni]|uniref:hypothetical protein n=1 Tax=Comamonas testosteroni TaxID=285 RepID=UPI000AA32971|nr:hypothetical protein [Comamonas testosteroni]
MPLQPINYGAAANDGTGDSLREAMRKSQANFEYLDQSKADAQATTQAIAQKADAQATTQAIAQKADAQATAQALEGKVTAEAGKSLMTDTERQKLEGIASGAQVNVATNLALGAATANAREITSSTGGSVTLPAATSSTAGLMTAAESTKLGTVATNASANSSDAFLLNRSNHSGPLNWAWSTYGGTANTITLTPAFAREAYATGDQFRFRAAVTNTGAATINVGGLGVKSAVTVTGAALPAGYIRTDVDTVCVYDGTRFVVQREAEFGSNANGTFVRHANGVLECHCANQNTVASNAFGSVFGSNPANFIFPAVFSAAPKLVPFSNSSGGWAISDAATTNAVAMFSISPLSGTTVQIGCLANGKWY